MKKIKTKKMEKVIFFFVLKKIEKNKMWKREKKKTTLEMEKDPLPLSLKNGWKNMNQIWIF